MTGQDTILALTPEEMEIVLRALRRKALHYRAEGDYTYARTVTALHHRIEAAQRMTTGGVGFDPAIDHMSTTTEENHR